MSPYTPAELAAREASLQADVERYAKNGGPSAEDLHRAPMLDDYKIAAVDGVILAMGWCVGHPRLRSGPIVTAEVVLSGDGWLRTTGRLYRLGQPLTIDPDVGREHDDIVDADDYLYRYGR